MSWLADRVGWAAVTLAWLAAAAATAWLGSGFPAVFGGFTAWCLAAYGWHRWTKAAWKAGAAAIAIDRACWLGAFAHLGFGHALRQLKTPGWQFLWLCSAFLLLAGAEAQRPRVDPKKTPRSTLWLLCLAAFGWPALGLALGLSAEEPKSGLVMGGLFSLMAITALASVWAIGDEGSKPSRAQGGSLVEDLGLLWAEALPRREPGETEELTPLSGYEFVSESAPARAAASPVEEQASPIAAVDRPTLVGSGGFRVDSEKALEKLSRFRSAEPADFVLGFFRAAVAAEASRFDVVVLPDGLRLTLGGRPLDPAALADPLGSLLTTGLQGAERELATGLLGALALPSCRVFIASGEGSKRRSLRAAARGVAPWKVEDPGAGTLVEVRWRGPLPVDRVGDALRRRVGLVELPWTIDGREQPPGPPPPSPAGWWRQKGKSPWLGPRRDLQATSRLRLYRLGTLIEEALEEKLTPFPVEACVRDDSFTLDLSQAKVVRDERYAAARKAVSSSFKPFKAWLEAAYRNRGTSIAAESRATPVGLRPWYALRSALGWPAGWQATRAAWERSVGQWLEATRGT